MNYYYVEKELKITSVKQLEKQDGAFYGIEINLHDVPTDLLPKLNRLVGKGNLKTVLLRRCFTNSRQLHETVMALANNMNTGLLSFDIRQNPIDQECVTEICTMIEKRRFRSLSLPSMKETWTVDILESVRKIEMEELNISGSCLESRSIELLQIILRARNVTKAVNLEDCVRSFGQKLTKQDKYGIREAEKSGRRNSLHNKKLKIKWFNDAPSRNDVSTSSYSYKRKRKLMRDIKITKLQGDKDLDVWRQPHVRRQESEFLTDSDSEGDEVPPYRRKVMAEYETDIPTYSAWWLHASRKRDVIFPSSSRSQTTVQVNDVVSDRLRTVTAVSFAIFQKQRTIKLCLWDPEKDDEAQEGMNSLVEKDYDFILRSEVTVENFRDDFVASLKVTEPEEYFLSLEKNRTANHFMQLDCILPEEATYEDKLEITYTLHNETGKFYIA